MTQREERCVTKGRCKALLRFNVNRFKELHFPLATTLHNANTTSCNDMSKQEHYRMFSSIVPVRRATENETPSFILKSVPLPLFLVAPDRAAERLDRSGGITHDPEAVRSATMRLRLAAAVLLSAAAYYVYLPLPSGVSEPWKLMLLDALFRSFMQAVRAEGCAEDRLMVSGGGGSDSA